MTTDDQGREGPPERDVPAPSPLDMVEWPLPRVLLELAVGAGGGAVLALLLPGAEERLVLFAIVGAGAAPVALLLTPFRGGTWYRAARYGGALAVLLMLLVSFLAGAEGLPVEVLLAFGALVFGIGALGHACLAITVDRAYRGRDGTWSAE